MARRVLITGVTGQDGAYLAHFLLQKGYEVYGGHRRNASGSAWRMEALGIERDVRPVSFDVLEITNVLRVLEAVRPDEIYNLAAQSCVAVSFEQPLYTHEVDGLGAGRILECIRTMGIPSRFYQASSSEMFGKVRESPQNETTPFHPRSPYGVAKVFAHWCTVNYREAHRLHASSGILFNHESPLRGREFVTRKVVSGLARIGAGLQDHVTLGNLDAQRDWGFSGDYVRGMWLMLQQPVPDDYVLATGEKHTVRAWVEAAAKKFGFRLEWQGTGANEVGIDSHTSRVIVRVNHNLYRPAEVDLLVGDARKAQRVLGWEATVTFSQLVEMMCDAESKTIARMRNLDVFDRDVLFGGSAAP